MEVYLDNAATTQCSDAVMERIAQVSTVDYGNPSSLHGKGVAAERYVREAAQEIARTLRCEEKEILFTSGGTESNNLATIGGAMANRRHGRHLVTTAIEHPSVQNAMNFLEELDFEVTRLPVNGYGEISPEALSDALRDDTILVSVMMVNNEVGALESVAEAGRLVHERHPDILFHVDAVQAYGKFRIHPKKEQIDLLSASAHKIHGPKGVGFLYLRDRAKVRPITFGGGQQRDMRSGTINAPGIAGMGEAAREAYADLDANVERMYELREHFIGRLLALENVHVNGRISDDVCDMSGAAFRTEKSADALARNCAPHIISATFPGIKSEVLLHALEEKGIYVSAGSACASSHPSDSTTLTAMGLTQEEQDSTLRFSMSIHTTLEELDYTADTLADLLPVLRRYKHF